MRQRNRRGHARRVGHRSYGATEIHDGNVNLRQVVFQPALLLPDPKTHVERVAVRILVLGHDFAGYQAPHGRCHGSEIQPKVGRRFTVQPDSYFRAGLVEAGVGIRGSGHLLYILHHQG